MDSIWQLWERCSHVQLREGGDEEDKYFRIRLKVDISKPLRRLMYITIENNERVMDTFRYERLPKLCFKCGRIGHLRQECSWEVNVNSVPDYLAYGPRLEAQNPLTRLKWSSPILHELDMSFGADIIPRESLPSPEIR